MLPLLNIANSGSPSDREFALHALACLRIYDQCRNIADNTHVTLRKVTDSDPYFNDKKGSLLYYSLLTFGLYNGSLISKYLNQVWGTSIEEFMPSIDEICKQISI